MTDVCATGQRLGRFGHHPEPEIDYECEIDALIGIAYERLTMGGHSDLEERITKAMAFQVLQRPGELRWLNRLFNGVSEIYAIKPAWVEWPEERIADLLRKQEIGQRLHDAAPDLLEALEAILKVRVEGWENIWAGSSRCQDIARAAIAKVRGEA